MVRDKQYLAFEPDTDPETPQPDLMMILTAVAQQKLNPRFDRGHCIVFECPRDKTPVYILLGRELDLSCDEGCCHEEILDLLGLEYPPLSTGEQIRRLRGR